MKTTKVMGRFVLLEKIEQTTSTKGGILLSEQDRKDIGVEKAKIIDKGPLCSDAIALGDVAIYNANRVDRVDVDGTIFSILPEDFIILIQRDGI